MSLICYEDIIRYEDPKTRVWLRGSRRDAALHLPIPLRMTHISAQDLRRGLTHIPVEQVLHKATTYCALVQAHELSFDLGIPANQDLLWVAGWRDERVYIPQAVCPIKDTLMEGPLLGYGLHPFYMHTNSNLRGEKSHCYAYEQHARHPYRITISRSVEP